MNTVMMFKHCSILMLADKFVQINISLLVWGGWPWSGVDGCHRAAQLRNKCKGWIVVRRCWMG